MNNNDKSLKKDNTSYKQISIGYLGPKILTFMQIKILSGIMKIAQEHNITLYQFGGPYPNDSNEVISQSSFVFKLIDPKKIHGIIGWSSQLCNQNGFFFDIEGFLDQNPDYPAVFIGKPVKDHPTVVINNFTGINEIMNHLIHVHNFKKIGYISGPESHYYAEERFNAYVRTLKLNNIPFNSKLVFPSGTFNPKYGAKAICYFLDNQNLNPKKDIEAIVSVSDVLSITAIEELKKRNIKVPQDIAVVGFNNKYESLASNPTITTIDIDFERMGKDSMELLISMLNGEKKTGIFYIPTRLIIRQSCGCMNGDSKAKKSSDRIPVNIDYNLKKEIIEKLIQQKEKILFQINKKTDILVSIDYKWSEALLTGLIESIKMESSHIFLDVVNNILEQMAAFNIPVFHRNQYFTEIREIISEIIVDNDLRSRVEILFNNANELLLQQTECKIAHYLLKMVQNQTRTIYLYQSIASTYELSALLDILAHMLPAIGIEACYFSLFCNPGESIEHATLKLAYNSKCVYKLYENKVLFESTQLIPARYYQKMDKVLYLIMPLYFHNTPMGFIIIGISRLSEFNGIIYEILRSLISSTLKGAMDLQELKFTQAQLEKKAEELRMAVMEANEANKQKTQFFINLAHETKTPLTLIQNYLALYMDQHTPDENLLVIKQNIDLMVTNILNFLDVEKLQRGRTIYQHDILVNLSASVEKKCTLFCEVAKAKKIKIFPNLEKNIIIRIDPYALDRILNNLLDNAVKYIQEKGKIWITVSSKKGRVILRISDNGPGLPVDTFEHIFEPYYLLSRKKTGQQGIGVGLSIVKKIVDELGASISVEKGKDVGTCFTISFKASKTSKAQESLQTIPITTPSHLVRGYVKEKNISPEKTSLLLVDDNIQLLKFIQTALSETYSIYLARNVPEALFKLRTIPRPALIISDIMMEGPDGFTLLKDLSEMEGYNDIPFIFLTALGEREAKLRGLDLGAVDYIEKPFSIAELIAKINSIIALRLRQERQEIAQIRSKIDGVLSSFQKGIIQSREPRFKLLCEKYKINSREQKIIWLLQNGLVHKEIAVRMNISRRAVEYHLSKIYKKCGVSNKYDLLNIFQG